MTDTESSSEIKEESVKAEVEKVTAGILAVVMFEFIIRFVQLQLFNIWFFVLVYPSVLLHISVSKRGYFTFTPHNIDVVMGIFSFGKITNGTFGIGDIFHYIFVWTILLSVIATAVGMIRAKITGKRKLISLFPVTMFSRVKFNFITLMLLIIPTMMLYVFAFGWKGLYSIPLIYIFLLCPFLLGMVVTIIMLERAVMVIGKKYFGMKFAVEVSQE